MGENNKKAETNAPTESAKDCTAHNPPSVESEDVIRILDELPDDKKQILIRAFMHMERKFSGPLPAPEDFIMYKNALPDAPERIMSMAEKQTDHRISCESRIIELKGRENLLGQIAGFLIAICCLVVACILGLNGHDWLAGVIPTSIAGLAAVFVLRKKKESKEAKGTTDADPEQE